MEGGYAGWRRGLGGESPAAFPKRKKAPWLRTNREKWSSTKEHISLAEVSGEGGKGRGPFSQRRGGTGYWNPS